MERVKVGVIGCGMISEIYIKNMMTLFMDILDVSTVADINSDVAKKRAEQFKIKFVSVDELLADPEIELVLNLTVPSAHFEVSRAALLSGKHCYSEKPFAINLDEGKKLLDLANEKGLLAASAPDTFLGGGLQTCRKLIDDGAIGKPIFVQGFMIGRGPEYFHPNPQFFYREGAGPLLDMGPYYYTALVSIFGPAKTVSGIGRTNFPTRKVLSTVSPISGQEFTCEVETLISGNIEFFNGVLANITTSWDMSNAYWEAGLPFLEAFGSEGALIMPDPNTFGGIGESPMGAPGKYLKLCKGDGKIEEIPLKYGFIEDSRGLGVADFARCIRNGGNPRVSGQVSFHILEMMLGTLRSVREHKFYEMTTNCVRPTALYDDIDFSLGRERK